MEFPNNEYQPLNLYTNFAEAAEKYPDTPILFDEPLVAFPEFALATTYAAAHELIVKRAAQLAEEGLKAGDKVIIYKTPKFDTYLLAVAVSYLGAVPAMISYHLPVETMSILADRLHKPWLIYDYLTAEKAREIEHIPAAQLLELEQLITLNGALAVPQIELPLGEMSYITHTSGTTGVPKLIVHSAQSMGWRTKWQKTIFDLIDERKLVAFHISPVHSRFNIGITSLMSKGFPLLAIGSDKTADLKATLVKHQPYAFETHPNNFVQWSRLARKEATVFSSIKYYHSTFDAINKGAMSDFLACSRHEKPVFMQVYGQSECGPMIMKFHTKESLPTLNARNMGVGMPNLTEVRIVDESGSEVATGEKGNIQMLSKGRALTYYKEDARFAENVYDAWWDSGDYGFKDENGELFLLDRQVDLIKKVDSNLAIEDILLDSLEFLEEVVIVRDKDNLPQPIVALAEGEEMDWERWWSAIADYPYLNEAIIMPFAEIPRTATMKVQRLQLEKAFKQGSI